MATMDLDQMNSEVKADSSPDLITLVEEEKEKESSISPEAKLKMESEDYEMANNEVDDDVPVAKKPKLQEQGQGQGQGQKRPIVLGLAQRNWIKPILRGRKEEMPEQGRVGVTRGNGGLTERQAVIAAAKESQLNK
ncbi:hypothetical protein ACFE04_027568 [Oxalis oulophora]